MEEMRVVLLESSRAEGVLYAKLYSLKMDAYFGLLKSAFATKLRSIELKAFLKSVLMMILSGSD